MIYLMIDLYTHFIHDWQRSFEIVNSFVEGLEQGWMVGYSYNMYSGDRPLSCITIRFNFVNEKVGKQNAERIINNLINRRLIVAKGEWSPFGVSPTVMRATEISTKCSFALKNWMDANSNVLSYYLGSTQNKILFMSRFLTLLLRLLGFQSHLEEYPIDEDMMNLIRSCAEYCAEQIRPDIPQELSIDFMERMIHHFLNCVHINLNEEQIVYSQIYHWKWLSSLLENRR